MKNDTPPQIRLALEREILFNLSQIDEQSVNTVDILAFKVDNEDPSKETFAYKTKGRNIIDDLEGGGKKFTVSLLRDSENQYRFVLLAGARAQITVLGDIAVGTAKDDILNDLQITIQNKWITDTADPQYMNIPMWAETPPMYVDDELSLITGIKFTRMLARVDVVVDGDAVNSFDLKSVRIYNYNKNGRIVPNTSAEYWDGNKALKPTLSEPSDKTFGPLVYRTSVETPNIIQDIYLNEAVVSEDVSDGDITCMVIGGEYNKEGKTTFYRIDFKNTIEGGQIKYFDIIRNYQFAVRVTKVLGSGYGSPGEAFDSGPMNLETNISVWHKREFPNLVIDGEYILAVTNESYILPLNQRNHIDTDNRLNVFTDHPFGWRVDKIVESDDSPALWLSLNRYVGYPNTSTETIILADENITEKDRTAYIHIVAGRLEYVVSVTQTTIPELSLIITNQEGGEITDILFYSHVGGEVPAQQVNIRWTPRANQNVVSVIPIAGVSAFNFGTGDRISSGYILDAIDGTKTYNIQPPAMTPAEINADPFKEKAIRADFTVGNGVTYESKVFFLIQKNFAAVPTTNTSYSPDGSEQSFVLKANAPWKIKIVDDQHNIINQLVKTWGGQYEDKRDETVAFITNNVDVASAEVVIVIKSTNINRPFPDKTFSLNFTK